MKRYLNKISREQHDGKKCTNEENKIEFPPDNVKGGWGCGEYDDGPHVEASKRDRAAFGAEMGGPYFGGVNVGCCV